MKSKYLNQSVENSIEKLRCGDLSSVAQCDWKNLAEEIQYRLSLGADLWLEGKTILYAFRDVFRLARRHDSDNYFVGNLPRPQVSEDHLSLSERVENGIERALEQDENWELLRKEFPGAAHRRPIEPDARNLMVILRDGDFRDQAELNSRLEPYLEELLRAL